ncbi:uncharacterized protein LOC134279384 [Saccostrea cucullata]|uniref:uncharacterized protein LOC134279384 n=1 Tax=Saccostrea cuccullata TaxID=36930 RepID=UPI002ED1E54D
MFGVDYKFLIIMISSCLLTNAHSLLTEDNEVKTKDIDILRQLLNQETLLRITLTKDVEKLKQRILSKQDDKDNIPTTRPRVLEENNFINASLLQTLVRNVSGHTIEEINNKISLQMQQFSQFYDNFTKLSAILLNGIERLENVSVKETQKSDAMDVKVQTGLLDKRYRDCQEILKQNISLRNQNGVYTIYSLVEPSNEVVSSMEVKAQNSPTLGEKKSRFLQ